MSEIIQPNGVTPQEVPQAEVDEKKRVVYGFDENGFFNFKIHVAAGQPLILGWLEQCKDVVKIHYQQMHIAQQPKLTRPARNFFNKWR